MSKIFVDQVDPKTATTLTLGTTGDTVDIPTGVTLSGAGTITPSAINIAASGAGGVTGTLPIANGGTGASSLTGDQTYTTNPSFHAYNPQNGSMATNTQETIEFDTELFDSNGCFNTTTFRFTPAIQGKYFIYWSLRWQSSTTTCTRLDGSVRFNDSSDTTSARNNNTDYSTVNGSGIINMDTDDFIELAGFHNLGVSANISTEAALSYFGALRLIGVA